MGPSGPHSHKCLLSDTQYIRLQHHTAFSESDPSAISERGSLLYLTSTSHPSSLPINKAPSPKTYPLKRSMAKRSSRHNGEVTTGHPVASAKFLLIHSLWRDGTAYTTISAFDIQVFFCARMALLHTVLGASGSGSIIGVTKLSTLMPEVWPIPCQRVVGEGQRPVV